MLSSKKKNIASKHCYFKLSNMDTFWSQKRVLVSLYLNLWIIKKKKKIYNKSDSFPLIKENTIFLNPERHEMTCWMLNALTSFLHRPVVTRLVGASPLTMVFSFRAWRWNGIKDITDNRGISQFFGLQCWKKCSSFNKVLHIG